MISYVAFSFEGELESIFAMSTSHMSFVLTLDCRLDIISSPFPLIRFVSDS